MTVLEDILHRLAGVVRHCKGHHTEAVELDRLVR